ncbi:MAG: hypothetical protein GX803_01305 [Lentisphaerae bacterium]|jgi:parvulin-like peptidyl-prolyl isomerase|nr:hypothetical protein [Lentisphaerota bacterium]
MNTKPILAALLLAGVTATAATRPGILLDSYAAIVNGKVITVGDVLSAMPSAVERSASPSALLQSADFQTARDYLVEAELILAAFEMQGGTLPDRAIEDHINSVIFERFNNDRAAFLRALAVERLTFSEWRKQMKDQLIVQYMRRQEVGAKILITPYDLQQAYERNLADYARPEQVRLQSLILPPPDTSDSDPDSAPDPATQAEQLRDQLNSGQLAIADAPGTLADPEWFDVPSLHPDIRAAIQDQAPGTHVGPVQLGVNSYLLQLIERQAAHTLSLEEVAPDIENALRKAEFERLNHLWIDSLRAKYFVLYFTPESSE